MRMRGLLTVVGVVAACRGNFEVVPDVAPAPPDAPSALTCQPTRFSMSGMVGAPATLLQTTTQIVVTPTRRGYHVFIVAGNSELHGVSFEFVGNQLVEKARTSKPIAINVVGRIGAVALDRASDDPTEVLLAVPCSATCTALIALDDQLRPASGAADYEPVIYDGWTSGYGSLVPFDSGRVVFLAVQDATRELHARLVSRRGIDQDSGSPTRVATGGNPPSGQMILRAGTGYLVLWDAANLTPNQVQATMLDSQLAARDLMPTKISAEITMDSDLPMAAYSESSRVSLFAWVVKLTKDQVWFSVRDEQLQTTQTISMMPEGNMPRIAAGKDDFLVVWTDAGGSQLLSAARIALDGTLTRPGLSTTGGRALDWDLVVRDGLPALIWFEEVVGGPYLWFDALCRPD